MPKANDAKAIVIQMLLDAGFEPAGETEQETVRILSTRSPLFGKSGGELATPGGHQRFAKQGTDIRATVGARMIYLYRATRPRVTHVAQVPAKATDDVRKALADLSAMNVGKNVMRSSICQLADDYAKKGQSLRVMSAETAIAYGKLKSLLKASNYSHPRGIELTAYSILSEIGISLKEYIYIMIEKGESINTISKDLGVDNKTLQNYGDKEGIVFPAAKPIPKKFKNIIAAIKERQHKRSDLVWFFVAGKRMYAQKASEISGIKRTTLIKRRRLGWTDKEIFDLVPSQTQKSMTHKWRPKVGDLVVYIGKYSKKIKKGDAAIIASWLDKERYSLSLLGETKKTTVLLKNIVPRECYERYYT